MHAFCISRTSPTPSPFVSLVVMCPLMQSGRNALHLAAAGGHIGTIHYLAPKMVSLLHSTDNSGYTVLHWAAREGHTEVAQCVITEFKLDPMARDKVCGCISLYFSASHHILYVWTVLVSLDVLSSLPDTGCVLLIFSLLCSCSGA